MNKKYQNIASCSKTQCKLLFIVRRFLLSHPRKNLPVTISRIFQRGGGGGGGKAREQSDRAGEGVGGVCGDFVKN